MPLLWRGCVGAFLESLPLLCPPIERVVGLGIVSDSPVVVVVVSILVPVFESPFFEPVVVCFPPWGSVVEGSCVVSVSRVSMLVVVRVGVLPWCGGQVVCVLLCGSGKLGERHCGSFFGL